VCLTVASLILKATPNPLLLLPMATAWSTSISWGGELTMGNAIGQLCSDYRGI
jgi:hypothetical protein